VIILPVGLAAIAVGELLLPLLLASVRMPYQTVGLRWREFFPAAPSCARWPRRCSPIGARSPAARGVMRIRVWSWLR
jgi:hypothetical protein